MSDEGADSLANAASKDAAATPSAEAPTSGTQARANEARPESPPPDERMNSAELPARTARGAVSDRQVRTSDAPPSTATAGGAPSRTDRSSDAPSRASRPSEAPLRASRPSDRPRSTLEGLRIEPASPLVCPSCAKENPADARFCMSCALGLRGDEPVIELRRDADPLVGRVIAGRYRIEEVIGRGGMGVVYRVEHVRMGKLMAMKLLHGDLARDKEVVRRFRREAEAVSKLDHPNTVQIFDFGESDGMTWLVMELLSGKDLGVVLAETHTLTFERAARIAWQIAGSVHQAHERGIVHRDLKPENVRVLSDRTESEFVKVLDFGLAKLRETEEQKRASITREGFLVGTPYYMAPEHIRGDAVDARSDVYALGAVLYKCVTGMPPFWAPTPVGVLTKHLTEDPAPPSRKAPRELPPEADDIILRSLEKDPADRYQSMVGLKEALADYLASVGQEPSSGRLTMPASALHKPTPSGRPAAIATRDEFDRYEHRVRTQDVAGRVLIVALALTAAATSWWAWGDTRIAAPTSESEPNDTVTASDAIALDVPLTGHVGARVDTEHGDTDVFSLGRLPPEVRWLEIEFTGLPNADTLLDVYVHGRTDPILVIDGSGYGQPEGVPNLPVDPSLQYVVRVREEVEHARYPIENFSDAYTLSIRGYTPGENEEREPNETTATSAAALVPSEWAGYVGWSSDTDRYCLGDLAPAALIELTGVAMLDLALELSWPTTGRTTDVNSGGVGEPEAFTTAAGAVCVTVSARDGTRRSDPVRAYTLRFLPAPAPEALP